jgi:hypothetical protein
MKFSWINSWRSILSHPSMRYGVHKERFLFHVEVMGWATHTSELSMKQHECCRHDGRHAVGQWPRFQAAFLPHLSPYPPIPICDGFVPFRGARGKGFQPLRSYKFRDNTVLKISKWCQRFAFLCLSIMKKNVAFFWLYAELWWFSLHTAILK